MLLSYKELCEVVEKGYIRGVDPEAINAATIDMRLGPRFLSEANLYPAVSLVDCSRRQSVGFRECTDEVTLYPQDFVLAHTIEEFYLPDNISAEFSLKSSVARNGLEHLNACWIDAGFHGSVLTLELKNMCRWHALRLEAGMFIGQIKLFKHTEVPANQSYRARGRYNNDSSVQGIRK